jgi:hypothetical protein
MVLTITNTRVTIMYPNLVYWTATSITDMRSSAFFDNSAYINALYVKSMHYVYKHEK